MCTQTDESALVPLANSAEPAHPARRHGARPLRIRIVRTVAWACWAYPLLLGGVWLLLFLGGDRWWFATLLLFAPRWPYGLPLVGLAPIAATFYRRGLGPLMAGALLLLGPVMGLCIPWPAPAESAGTTLRILTCNVQGGDATGEKLAELVRSSQPDVVTLQELWGSHSELQWPQGWHTRRDGELLIASRFPIRDLHRLPAQPDAGARLPAIHCLVDTPHGPIGICCMHLPSARDGLGPILDRHTIINPARTEELSQVIELRWRQSGKVEDWLDQCSCPTIVCGDFNMPADSAIYRNHWSDRQNAFTATGRGFGYTKLKEAKVWLYGIRIDHILLRDSEFHCLDCWVGPDVGSDHLPLLADIGVPSP